MIERIGDQIYADERPFPHRPLYEFDCDVFDWSVEIAMENGTNIVLRHLADDDTYRVSLWVTSPDPDLMDCMARIDTRNGEKVIIPLVGLAEVVDGWVVDDVDGPEVWFYLAWLGKMEVVHPTAQMIRRRAW
jgi:hypothetical protein